MPKAYIDRLNISFSLLNKRRERCPNLGHLKYTLWKMKSEQIKPQAMWVTMSANEQMQGFLVLNCCQVRLACKAIDQFHKYSNVPIATKNMRGEIINRLSLEIRGLYCLNWNQKKIEVFSCPKWEGFQNKFCDSNIKIFTFDMK